MHAALNRGVTPGLTPLLPVQVSGRAPVYQVAPGQGQEDSSAILNSGEAYPPCPSCLGLTGSLRRSRTGTNADGRGDGCSNSSGQNVDIRPREVSLEVFGENGLDHPGDYSGVYPQTSYSRAAVCALGIAPP